MLLEANTGNGKLFHHCCWTGLWAGWAWKFWSHHSMAQTLQFLLKPSMVFISASVSSKSNTCTEKINVSHVQQPTCIAEINNSSARHLDVLLDTLRGDWLWDHNHIPLDKEAQKHLAGWWHDDTTRLQASPLPLTNLCWDFYLRRGFFVLLSDSFDSGFIQQGGVFWFSPASKKKRCSSKSSQMFSDLRVQWRHDAH